MEVKNAILLFFLICFYLIILFLFKAQIFQYTFDKSLIEKYMRSQDIPHEVKGRVFLSDSEIHEAAGYLYISGEDPTNYNFQHPPLIKYLYGISIFFWNNPFIMQVILGCLLIIGTYTLAFKLFNSYTVAVISSLLLIIDPLFIDLSSNLLLDLGQTTLLIFFVISFLFYTRNWISAGIILGLLAGSKFWGGATLFFVGILTLFLVYKKQVSIKILLLQYITAIIIFCLIYLSSFISQNGLFNIVYFELKTFKYWLQHSVSSIFGASIIMFITGYFKTWWEPYTWERTAIWSILWPSGLISSTFFAIKLILQKQLTLHILFCVIPLLYLFYLGIQAPFSRYYIIILPFIYIMTVGMILRLKKQN